MKRNLFCVVKVPQGRSIREYYNFKGLVQNVNRIDISGPINDTNTWIIKIILVFYSKQHLKGHTSQISTRRNNDSPNTKSRGETHLTE